jgi:hypothetical protein
MKRNRTQNSKLCASQRQNNQDSDENGVKTRRKVTHSNRTSSWQWNPSAEPAERTASIMGAGPQENVPTNSCGSFQLAIWLKYWL